MIKIKTSGLFVIVLLFLTACQNLLPIELNAPNQNTNPEVTIESTQEPTTSPVASADSTDVETNSSIQSEENQVSEGPTFDPINAEVGPIKIGYMGPLSGGAAFVGIAQIKYLETVVEIYNQQSGLDIQIVSADTELNPEIGLTIAETFVDDPDIIGVVGPAGSQVCEATQPIFEAGGLAHITPSCTKTDLTNPGTTTFFRPIPTDADQSRAIAAHMIVASDVYSLHILEDQSSYAAVLSDELTLLLRNSGISTKRSSFTQTETDFSTTLMNIINNSPDAVFIATQFENQTQALTKGLNDGGFGGFIYMPDTGFSSGWVQETGQAAEGVYVTFFAPDPNLVPQAERYNQAYRSTFESDPTPFGGAAGMATEVLLKSISQCANRSAANRECVTNRLNFIELDDTLLGLPISFQQGNQAKGIFSIFQIQNSEFNLLSGADDPGTVSK
ncbi:MAG: branched-chain amino acid ABC transporter substrate-binding protein [Chloroflexota bacterium]